MKYLLTPSEFNLQNPRIDGFKKIHEVNAKTIDIQIVTPECFSYFKKNNSLPNEFVAMLPAQIESTTADINSLFSRGFFSVWCL